MGYYSDLDIRVRERGCAPETKLYNVTARGIESDDCREARGEDTCRGCRDFKSAGCVWGERGDRAYNV